MSTGVRNVMRGATAHLVAAGVVALAALACLPFRAVLTTTDVAMVFLLAVVVIATRPPRSAALLASVLAIVAFDVGFVPPYGRLAVHEGGYLLTFAMMLGIAVLMSGLTARMREQAERQERAQVAVAAERLRTALLSSLSHDLRTPLAGIEGAAGALREGGERLAADARADLVDGILVEARRMDRLVANLLDMVRVESGTLAVQKQWQPLEEVVGVALLRTEERLRHHGIVVTLPDDLPLVAVDEILLEQVFVNLLENAARYTPAGTRVDISAAAREGAVHVQVADRGPGIGAGEEEAIFRKFQRGRSAGASPGAGSGLGLTICRGIVAAHGGRMWAERRNGGGTAIHFTIPIDGAPPALPPEEALQ
jgi:two-component system sensor histidine kinase KdpD